MSNASAGSISAFEWQIQNNKNVISRLVNDPEISQSSDEPGDLQYNYLPNDEPDDLQYYVQPDGDNELELLGRLVGMTHIKKLSLIGGPTSQTLSINPFFTGLSNNKSISEIIFFWYDGPQAMLCKGSMRFSIWLNDDFGNQMAAMLSAAMKNKILHTLNLRCNGGIDIGEEWIDVLVSGISNSNLLNLDICGINGSVKGVDTLVAALPRSNLVTLSLINIDIGEREVKALARALKADPCLENLRLPSDISIDGLVAIAEALANNSHLKRVHLSYNVVTSECWMAFSTTLCDTSTVNKTCISNHTLEHIGDQTRYQPPYDEGFVPRPQEVASALDSTLISSPLFNGSSRCFLS